MIVHSVKLLRWLYLGRMTLAAGVFAGAVLVWPSVTPGATLIATLAFLAALGFGGGSWWYTNILGRPATTGFLYAQLVFDTFLVTAIVHITNGPDSSFPPLYILVIAAGALLLPLPGGVLIGALACILYFVDAIWFHRPLGGEYSEFVNLLFLSVPAEIASALLQMVVFALVALTAGALGDRLRRTGQALGVAESELRRLRLDTDDILGAVDTGLITVVEGGRVAYINAAAEAALGLRSSERGELTLADVDRCVPGMGSVISRTARTRVPVRRSELRMRGPKGDRYIGVRTTILDRSGSRSVTAVFQDITDSKQIEDLLRRTERLQAVAELGASLAHEIKNPLASIRSAVEQLAGSPLRDDDKTKLRGLVVNESNRLSRLLSEFMEFSRVELRRRMSIDLTHLIGDAIGLVSQHPDAQGSARIEYEPAETPLHVDGDSDLLHRAVFNLVLNAVQHAGPGGVVRVEVGRALEAAIPSSVQVRSPVRLSVRDTGPGIPDEDVPRVFDPFFTTRAGGTGLGLAMVYRAVEAHHGTILVDGGAGSGAEFTVYLPMQVEAVVAAVAAP